MPGRPERIERRAWLAAAIVACGRLCAHGQGLATAPKDDDAKRAAVERQADRAGLGPLRASRTDHYLGLGDAPDVFRGNVLRMCEALAIDYLDHYRSYGFAVRHPDRRLIAVTLAHRRSFVAFLGTEPGPDVTGLYHPGLNALVVYDHRVPSGGTATGRPRFVNQVTLAHEATHQLTFNTGLLEREGDVPLCIGEGLAQYGEVRKTIGRSEPGMVNQERLKDLAYGRRRGHSWTPVARLLVDDGLLRGGGGGDRSLVAYAQSWLLVHLLMKDPARRPTFRAYLRAIRGRRSPDRRLDDAREYLGDLVGLDRHLFQHAIRLMKQA